VSELRQDPVTRDWVIINPGRALRPHDGVGSDAAGCPFCPGHEALAPQALDSIDAPDGSWLVRALPNKYPVLSSPPVENPGGAHARFGRWLPGRGYHEVIVESPEHGTTLGAMPYEQLRRVLEMYARRYRALAARDGSVRQVVLFRNQGTRAGTSLTHPHSQIVATPAVSPETRGRVNDEIAYFDERGRCGLCQVLDDERAAAERVVLETGRFATFAPYASSNPYQLQTVPLRHCPSFLEVDEGELDDLAVHLTRVVAALRACLDGPHYNLVVSSPPLDLVHRSASHWFIEILPRVTTPAGFELGSRIVVNVKAPEQAASELRAAVREAPRTP
jgi:UDPglucose--hexose-1-phosphate uridylyltransferase